MITLNYIKKKAEELKEHGISNGKNEIIWFLEHTNIINKNTLYSWNLHPITQKTKVVIDNFVNKRNCFIPFQYIINSCDFYGKEFTIDKRALIPRPETETIIHYLKKKESFNNVLEIGTGSGILSCILSLEKIGKQILATDISQEALDLAKENINSYKINNIELKKHNILQDTLKTQFDLIISNPPYVSLQDYNKLSSEIKNYEPRQALTDNDDGLVFYRRFAQIIKYILKPKGSFYCEIGKSNTCNEIENIFKKNNYTINWMFDLNKAPRYFELVCT